MQKKTGSFLLFAASFAVARCYSQVYRFAGDYRAWKAKGYPVE